MTGDHAVNVANLFRRLSAEFGWTPNDIAELTPAQAWMYLDRVDRGGTGARVVRCRSLQEARKLIAEIRNLRDG